MPISVEFHLLATLVKVVDPEDISTCGGEGRKGQRGEVSVRGEWRLCWRVQLRCVRLCEC
jgi:hypothetical protein